MDFDQVQGVWCVWLLLGWRWLWRKESTQTRHVCVWCWVAECWFFGVWSKLVWLESVNSLLDFWCPVVLLSVRPACLLYLLSAGAKRKYMRKCSYHHPIPSTQIMRGCIISNFNRRRRRRTYFHFFNCVFTALPPLDPRQVETLHFKSSFDINSISKHCTMG